MVDLMLQEFLSENVGLLDYRAHKRYLNKSFATILDDTILKLVQWGRKTSRP
jgi:hypothetical protein